VRAKPSQGERLWFLDYDTLICELLEVLLIGDGYVDHYGALPSLARGLQGQMKPGLTLQAGGEDTFWHR
jgi:hypothetical protein